MRSFLAVLPAVAVALVLSACVSGARLDLADHHPASPKAASGAVDTPSAIATYKNAADFAAQVTADTEAALGSHAEHGAMPGMPGMRHEGAPQGAGER
jgi:hypothetical protein